jgi:hypothetical protein
VTVAGARAFLVEPDSRLISTSISELGVCAMRWNPVLAAGFFLAACTTSPPSPNAAVNVEEITYAVLSELYCSINDLRYTGENIKNPDDERGNYFLSPADQWIMAIELNLSTAIEGAVNPTVSLLGPFNPSKAVQTGGSTGSFTTAVGASFDQTRTNARDYKIYVDVNHLMGQRDPNEATTKVSNWHDFARDNLHLPVNCPYPNTWM